MGDEVANDTALIIAAQAGDDDAFGLLVARQAPALLRLAARALGDADDAEDVVQETFLQAYGALHTFRGEAGLGTWLGRIALRRCQDRWARERRRDEIAEARRARRKGKAGRKWHAHETYIKVHDGWCYLYRAIDADANLIDSMLSERRDMEAARRFFAWSQEVVGHAPEKVTTDGHDAYPRAVRETLGEGVAHRCSQYLNNRLEQDHRGIKQRHYPMRGFGSFVSAARFCTAHDEVRDYFRHRVRMHEVVPLGIQREQYRTRSAALRAMLVAA